MDDKIDTIIFDADGTLIDSSRDIWRSINLTFEQSGLPQVSYEEAKAHIGPGAEHLVRSLLPSEELGRTREILKAYRSLYAEHCLDETNLYPGITDVLKHFSPLNLMVATNKPRYITEKILEGLGVQRYFKAVLGPEDVENLKPHPEMILKALKIAETTEGRAIVIGDTANDIIAGRAVGVYTCGVTYGYCPKESLVSQNPDFLIDGALELIPLLNG